MKIIKKTFSKFMLLVLIAISNSSMASSSSENWPNGPITTIVPWAVGGLADQVNRAMAQFGEEYFGQPIIPVNRVGAGGVVALTEYLRERPNSTKIIYGSEGNFSISPKVNQVAYSWDDFTPVMNIYSSSFVLVSNPKAKINSLDDLMEYGKNNKILFGVNGLNSTEFIILKALLSEMGLDSKGVAYQGANEAMNSTIAGDTFLSVTHASLAKEYVRSGVLNPVVVFDDKPLKDDVYNLKSVKDYGYDTFIVNRMMMLMPANTDPDIIDKVRTKFTSILMSDDFKEIARKLNVNIDPVDGAALNEHVDQAIKKVNKYSDL